MIPYQMFDNPIHAMVIIRNDRGRSSGAVPLFYQNTGFIFISVQKCFPLLLIQENTQRTICYDQRIYICKCLIIICCIKLVIIIIFCIFSKV